MHPPTHTLTAHRQTEDVSTHSLPPSLTHSLTHSLTSARSVCGLRQASTHSLTHSLTRGDRKCCVVFLLVCVLRCLFSVLCSFPLLLAFASFLPSSSPLLRSFGRVLLCSCVVVSLCCRWSWSWSCCCCRRCRRCCCSRTPTTHALLTAHCSLLTAHFVVFVVKLSKLLHVVRCCAATVVAVLSSTCCRLGVVAAVVVVVENFVRWFVSSVGRSVGR